MSVLYELSHKSQSISTVCRYNGGNFPSVTKVGLVWSGGCVGVQSEFLKAYTQKLPSFLNSSHRMKTMHVRKNQTVIQRIPNAPGEQRGSGRQGQVGNSTRRGLGVTVILCWVSYNE